MNSYSVFARFYDSVMGERMPQAVRIEEMVRQYNPTAETLLELGCGTGTFLKYFSEHGFRVEGIDISKEMLAVARQKLPGVRLTQQNMTSFSLPYKFDVIICLFDSINHLVKFTDWEAVFAKVRLHLSKGGLFIFDINTQHALETLVQTKPIVKKFDNKKITMAVTLGDGAYNWNIQISEKKDGSKETVLFEDIQEQSFSIQRIQDSLKKLFNEIIVIDQNGGKASETSQRVYFACRITQFVNA